MKEFLSWLPPQWRLIVVVLVFVAYTAWIGSSYTHDLRSQSEAISREIRRIDRNIERINLDYWGCTAEKQINALQRIAICKEDLPACTAEAWPTINCPAPPYFEAPYK